MYFDAFFMDSFAPFKGILNATANSDILDNSVFNSVGIEKIPAARSSEILWKAEPEKLLATSSSILIHTVRE